MTDDEAVSLIRRFLLAPDQGAVMQLVQENLPRIDATFFATANAASDELTRSGRKGAAQALTSLCDTMLRMKTLI
jgi:hypothetical protein